MEHIKDGYKNGVAQYALVDSGKVKVVITCPFCKQSAYAWLHFSNHPQYGIVPNYKELDQAYAEHIMACSKAKARYELYRSRGVSESSAMASTTVFLKSTVFHWVKRGDGGHQVTAQIGICLWMCSNNCSAKCRNATGPSCECKCGGENHGGN